MKSHQKLNKETQILLASLDDHRNFLWHLRCECNSKQIEKYLEISGHLEKHLNAIKAQAIEDAISLFLDGSTYDVVNDVRDNLINYANEIRGRS